MQPTVQAAKGDTGAGDCTCPEGSRSRGIAIHILTTALREGEWSASRPGRPFLWNTRCRESWVSSTAGLDALE